MAHQVRFSASQGLMHTDPSAVPSMWFVVRLEGLPNSTQAVPDEGPLAVDVCLVADCSWWMQEDKIAQSRIGDEAAFQSKLELVRAALVSLPTHLSPGNTLSVIGYSDDAVAYANRTTCTQGDIYRSAVQSIQPRSHGRLAVGLAEAGKLLRSQSDRRCGRIVLLTGGRVQDASAGLVVAEELADEGIGIDAICVGYEGQLTFLEELASFGGGKACLIHTTEQATDVLTDLLRCAQNLETTKLRVKIATGCTHTVRYCVKANSDNLVLPAYIHDGDDVHVVRLAGIPRNDHTDLYFCVTAPALSDENVHEVRVVVEFPKQSSLFAAAINVLPSEDVASFNIDALNQNISHLEIKCWEKEWANAASHGDHASAEKWLTLMLRRCEKLELPEGRELTTVALQRCRNKRPLSIEETNRLIEFTTNLTTRRVLLDQVPANSTSGATAEDTSCSPANPELPCSNNMLGSIYDHLLQYCQQALDRRERLIKECAEEEVAAAANSSVSKHCSVAQDRLVAAREWLQFAEKAGSSWTKAQTITLEEMGKAMAEWAALEQRISAGEHRQRCLRVLPLVLETVEFYRWEGAGWMATLNSLEHRRCFLEHVCEEGANDGLS